MTDKQKILFLVRSNFEQLHGGDRIQTLKYKEYLEKNLGFKVDLADKNSLQKLNLRDYSLAHAFNLDFAFELFQPLKLIAANNIPIVFSSIFWPRTELNKYGRVGLAKFFLKLLPQSLFFRLKAIFKCLQGKRTLKESLPLLLYGEKRLTKKLLSLVDCLLPNSESEMVSLNNTYKLRDATYQVIYNGIDLSDLGQAKEHPQNPKSEFCGAVVCACRIDERKNLFNLVKAANKQPFKLFVIGETAPGKEKYLQSLKNIATENIKFLPGMPQQQLLTIFKEAAVHVLPSWYETPGLANLEAGAMGCQLVVSPYGSTTDYFKDLAFYCHPLFPQSIRQNILKALEKKNDEKMANFIKENYTWDKAAIDLAKTYEKFIDKPEVTTN